MDYCSERNFGCRVMEYTHRGLKFLSMENELIRLVILADKGGDIVEMLYKPRDIDFMWKAPGGIRETAKYVPTIESSAGNYLTYLEGGWQEILPGGGPYTYLGGELGLHGEAALIPWSYIIEEDTSDKVSAVLSCRTYRFPFLVKKRISLLANSAVISFEEWLTNESGEDIKFLWAQHPAFGAQFVKGKCRIDIAAKEFETTDSYNSPTALFEPEHHGTWPVDTGKGGKKIDLSKVPPVDEAVEDLYYLKGLNEGWYAVTNTEMKLGIGFSWDIDIYPYVIYWQVCGGSHGYPWYGRTYHIGLELWNSFSDRFETAQKNNTIKTIKGSETISTAYKVIIYTGLDKVNHISREGVVK